MRRLLPRLLAAGLLWAVLLPAQAVVELNIAPDPVVLNESCRLTFRVTGEVDGEPDFTALEAVFDIIGRNRQTSINWINGQREQSTVWVLSAMPRAAGRIEIPAIQFGTQQSAARTVEIVAAARNLADTGADIMLEVEASPREPYVQQQVIYTVRLLHRVELNSSRFSALTTSSDAIVKPLGNGRQYVEQLGGRSFDAYEQRYAVFPQKSGELTINPLVLTTQVVAGTRGFFDPFAQSLTTRRVESQAVKLTVKAMPASFPADAAWLPARRLRLHEEWEPDVNSVAVGAPLARTLFLWADGLIAGQLPPLLMSTPDGVKLYPDQAQSNEQDTASGFTAVEQQKFAIIANGSGEVRFAALEIPWWNTDTDSLEFARLPERALSVSGATAALPPAVPAAAGAAPATATGAQTAPPLVASDATAWRLATFALAAAWLLTLASWWRSQRSRRRTTAHHAGAQARARAQSSARANRAVKAACSADDAPAAAAALLAWAATTQLASRAPPRTLGALGDRVEGEFASAIRTLERHLYGRAEGAWRGQPLWEAFNRYAPAPSATTDAQETALPELFKLAAN